MRFFINKKPNAPLQTTHRLEANSTKLATLTAVAAVASVQPTGPFTDSTKSDMFAANAQRMQMVMNRLGLLLRNGDKNIQHLEQPLLALARLIFRLLSIIVCRVDVFDSMLCVDWVFGKVLKTLIYGEIVLCF